MVTKISSELLPLTRDLASQFSTMMPMPGERPLRASRLRYFERLLKEGAFNSPSWAKAILAMNETDTELRADGQHTSQILAACEPALFPADLNVTITTYRVDSTADLSDLFDLFDNPISARTNTDKMGVYVADYEDLAAVDRAFLAKTARGIDYYLRDTSNPEDAARTALVLHSSRNHGLYFNEAQNRNFALWLYQWRGARHAWMISKPGLVAEMFADWRNYPSIAETFWSQVFTESNPDPNDDTRELASTLKDWVRKSPSPKQNKLRARAKKIWDRYRRQMAQIQRAA